MARTAARRRFMADAVIDDGILLWFPAPASFTGEDVAELHVHGGRAVWQAIADALAAAGGRLAEPGEFSRRAFENGKLDLTQAEAIADLVAAETEAQRRQAMRQLEGELGRLYAGWRSRILDLMARAEAAIDFSEEDIPDTLLDEVRVGAKALAADMARHIGDGGRGMRLRDGIRVAILGVPNAGKSSLLNALVGRAAAIVHPTAGTTRDIVEAAVDLRGWPVVFCDSAGLRVTDDAVEAEGVRRAQALAAGADVRLLVVDLSDAASEEAVAGLVDDGSIIVLNKSDLSDRDVRLGSVPHMRVCAATGAGVEELGEALATMIADRYGGGVAMPTRERHRAAVAGCIDRLEAGVGAELPELLAEDLRLAARSLGMAVGSVGVEEVLDRVFREFCIGK